MWNKTQHEKITQSVHLAVLENPLIKMHVFWGNMTWIRKPDPVHPDHYPPQLPVEGRSVTWPPCDVTIILRSPRWGSLASSVMFEIPSRSLPGKKKFSHSPFLLPSLNFYFLFVNFLPRVPRLYNRTGNPYLTPRTQYTLSVGKRVACWAKQRVPELQRLHICRLWYPLDAAYLPSVDPAVEWELDFVESWIR